ncbi:hypothetical protein [Actinomadura rugatobispora]|uniref:Secreted protein n=1 Tax=Actinomadura rugatobispora TaxID=1994 RepID=A0ABW0ZYW9_9ACTN|nr:hypothetical protein GCM10010200_037750 [Actinomadura rugatobispora]
MRKAIAAGVVVALVTAGMVADRSSRSEGCEQDAAPARVLRVAGESGHRLPLPSSVLHCKP